LDIEEAKRRAQAGPLILIARRGVALLVTFISTVTVARLVAPRDYGLANMSAIILGFAALFRDFGLTNAVLRKGEISQDELSLIFWFNTASTVFLAILIAAASPAIAAFYEEPVVLWVTLASVLGFLVSGLSLQHRAIINRALRFGALAITDTVGSLVGLAVTILLAFHGLGVWAIVAGGTVQSVLIAVAYIWLSDWKPSKPAMSAEFGSLLKFGGNASVFSISVFISQSLAPVLIGRFIGTAGVGQYNRAQALVNLPITNIVQPITQAVMPLLVHLRKDPAQYRSTYLQLVRNLSIALMPVAVCLAFAGPDLSNLLIGPRWHDAGMILSCLAPVLGVMSFSYGVADLFITQDRADDLRNLGLYEIAVRAVSIGYGLTFGLIGAALGFSLSTVVVAAFRVIVAGRKGPVSAIDQFRQLLPALPLCAGAVLACLLVRILGGALPVLSRAPIYISAGMACALIAGLVVPQSRRSLGDLAAVFGVNRVMAKLKGAN
jgi:PST family polysaccharide transporter